MRAEISPVSALCPPSEGETCGEYDAGTMLCATALDLQTSAANGAQYEGWEVSAADGRARFVQGYGLVELTIDLEPTTEGWRMVRWCGTSTEATVLARSFSPRGPVTEDAGIVVGGYTPRHAGKELSPRQATEVLGELYQIQQAKVENPRGDGSMPHVRGALGSAVMWLLGGKRA